MAYVYWQWQSYFFACRKWNAFGIIHTLLFFDKRCEYRWIQSAHHNQVRRSTLLLPGHYATHRIYGILVFRCLSLTQSAHCHPIHSRSMLIAVSALRVCVLVDGHDVQFCHRLTKCSIRAHAWIACQVNMCYVSWQINVARRHPCGPCGIS